MPKKKGKSKTDEEKTAQLKRQHLAAAAAAKKKNELLQRYLKNKLENEERMVKVNSLIVNHQWRLILRKVKSEEIRKDLQILKSTFDRVNDRKEHILLTLDMELAQSEEQYMMALRSHIQTLDLFVEVQNQRLERMGYSFDMELSLMKREYEAEKTFMVNRHRQRIDELKDTYVAFDRYFLQKEQLARNEYGGMRDEMKNRAIEDKHALRTKLEKKVEAIWAEFNNVKANYLKATEERRAYYEVLRKRNDQALKDIESQMSHLQVVTNKIVVVRNQVSKMQDEFKEKNRLLGEERERLSNHLLDLKKKICQLRDRQRRKLTNAVNVSNQVHKVMMEVVKEANIIIELGGMCRRLECEDEKVLPFYTSSLTPEDANLLAEEKDGEKDEELESMLKVYEPLNLFWHRFNRVQLDKLALLKERQVLEVENRHLKSLVTQYLENLSVNEKVMSEPNSLLIINGKHNLIVDPAVKNGKRRPVASIRVDGALMARNKTVSCSKY